MAQRLEPLLLHAHFGAANPFKVAILLEALELPYTIKLWELNDAPNGVKGPHFTKINENGLVPALEDPNTGVVAWESGAVLNYLLRTYDKSYKFHPSPSADPQVLVDFDKWIYFLVSALGPMFAQLVWYLHFDAFKNHDALKRYEEQTYRCFMVLEGQLKKTGGSSILESGYSAVDMHFYPWVSVFSFAKLSMDAYPHVKEWLNIIEKREDVKAAYTNIPKGEKALT